MKLSNAWLKADFGLDIKSDALAKKLTMAGLEVDDVLLAAGKFEKVVVGKVLEVAEHPNADKLHVTKVDSGNGILQIVCGAPNVAAGIKVPLALIGAHMSDGMKIKKSKLRGIESCGMLCSARELGLSEDHSGLMILPEDAPLGTDIREYLQFDDDIIDIDLTPNRADAFSMRGLARETAMLFDKPLPASLKDATAGVASVPATSDASITIDNEAPDDCPKYLARVIEGVDNTKKTPLWMQERLRRAGVRAHDPLVDVTNYVMMLLGTPLHAFDADKLSGGITVRHARAGEQLTLINGNSATLKENILVIADAEKPLAIAGVMGGAESACSTATQRIVLESAWFHPVTIAGKAREFGLSSDSAQRFERGVDFELQEAAMELATQLILEICGGNAGAVKRSLFADKLPKREAITLTMAALERRVGRSYDKAAVHKMFVASGCGVQESDAGFSVLPPSWRFDMEIPEDLIEEVARIDGYDNVPNRIPVVRYQKDTHPITPEMQANRLLVQLGLREVITYSFIAREAHKVFFGAAPTVNLMNPISAEMSEMRLSLLPGLVNALIYNRNRQQANVRLFELGNTFTPRGDKAVDCTQVMRVAGVLSGLAAPENWHEKPRAVDFYDVKGIIEALLNGVDFALQRSKQTFLHPGRSADIVVNGAVVGYFGALHPTTLRDLGAKGGDIWCFEMALSALATATTPQFKTIAKFPVVRRDLALVVDKSVTAGDLEKCIRDNASHLVTDLFWFDCFEGGSLPADKKSLALALLLQDEEKTLQDEDVEGIIASLVETLHQAFGAELR